MFESITLPIGHYRSSILFLKFAKYHAAPHSFAIKYLFTAYSDITPANLADRVREKVNHQSSAQQISYGICGAHGRKQSCGRRSVGPLRRRGAKRCARCREQRRCSAAAAGAPAPGDPCFPRVQKMDRAMSPKTSGLALGELVRYQSTMGDSMGDS